MIGLSGLITPSLDEMVHVAKEMQRLGMKIPLLIGGATTSGKHTAVKIAPAYENPVVHVLDASRSVGVVDRLMSDDLRDSFVEENRQLQQRLVKSYAQRTMKLIPYSEALQKRFETDWKTVDIPTPSFTGTRTIGTNPNGTQAGDGSAQKKIDLTIELSDLVSYIDWSPFFHTWELRGKYPKIFADEVVGKQAQELFDDAERMLDQIVRENWLTARGVYGFWNAASSGDDIIVFDDDSRTKETHRFCMLRQQWQREGQTQFRSLADYIAPLESGRQDFLGAFAVSAGFGCDERAAQFDQDHDDYNSIMVKALADRLAEAFAEFVHQQARKDWGFGLQEELDNDALIAEKYRGIRPAAGYPASPDHTEKSTLWNLLDAQSQTGIKLTESFAMWPGASVSGLYFAHPESRYFASNRVEKDQVEDYAKRKSLSVSEIERWLAPYLNYTPTDD